MNYNRLLETVSLPLFIIRICEEEEKKSLRPPGFGNVRGPMEQETLNVPSQLMLLEWSPLYAMRILMYSLMYPIVSSKCFLSFFPPSSTASGSCLVFGESMFRKTRKGIQDRGESTFGTAERQQIIIRKFWPDCVLKGIIAPESGQLIHCN